MAFLAGTNHTIRSNFYSPDVVGEARIAASKSNGHVLLELPDRIVWSQQSLVPPRGISLPIPRIGRIVGYEYYSHSPDRVWYSCDEWFGRQYDRTKSEIDWRKEGF